MKQNMLAVLLILDESAASGCLLKILGDTVISRLIRQLAKFGVERFMVISNVYLRRIEEEISRILEHNLNLKMLGVDDVRSVSWEKVIFVPANLFSDSETIKKLISIPEYFVLMSPADMTKISRETGFMDTEGRFLFASLDGRSCLASEILQKDSVKWANDIIRYIVDTELKRIRPQELSSYSNTVKTWFEPFVKLLNSKTSTREIERYLIKRAQKGKHITSYMNKPIEDFLSIRAARIGVTPNQMTVLSNVLAYSAIFSMLSSLPILSVSLMLATCVVDGLDGKIARLRSMESAFGSLEHSFDSLYEEGWYGSYVWYLFATLQDSIWLALGIYVLIVDAFVRHVYNQFRITTGIALTDSSPAARRFAKIDGRRNIYVIYVLVSLLSNIPTLALISIAMHTSLTAFLYLLLARFHLGRSAS